MYAYERWREGDTSENHNNNCKTAYKKVFFQKNNNNPAQSLFMVDQTLRIFVHQG